MLAEREWIVLGVALALIFLGVLFITLWISVEPFRTFFLNNKTKRRRRRRRRKPTNTKKKR